MNVDPRTLGSMGLSVGPKLTGISPEEVSARLRYAESFPGKKSSKKKTKKKCCGCK